MKDFGCTFERNFFGSRHGKGPSDGESTVVKHHAATAIKTGAAFINDAKDLFDHCVRSTLNKQPSVGCCLHFHRTFFWISSDDIKRNRGRAVQTLKGTRALHSVKCVEQHSALTRQLSCFCTACSSGVGDCQNADVVEAWKRQNLNPAADPHRDDPTDTPAQDDPTAAPAQDDPTAQGKDDPIAAPVQDNLVSASPKDTTQNLCRNTCGGSTENSRLLCQNP